MIVVYFSSSECVDDVVSNRTNHQFTSVIVVHFMNSARVCWIIRRTVFVVCICLSHSWKYKHNQFEKRDEKPRVLFVPFIKYTLSKFYSHCTQNCVETKTYFLETKICFAKKSCSISS